MIKIFLVQVLILITFSGFAQKGPGGVGDNDGTSNLSLWLDAGKITGVADGGNLNAWFDQSGNGYNATAAPKAPSYSVNGGGNGQPTLTFLHNDQQGMRITGNLEVKPTDELSVFVIGSMANGQGSRDPFISANSDNDDDDGYAIRQDNNVDRIVFFVDDLGNNNKYSPAYNLNEVWSMVFNTTDNKVYTYKSEDGNTFNFSGTITYDRDGNGPNEDVHIGSGWDNSNYAYFLTGQIQEVILFDVAINDAQRIIISNYLAAKYAISLFNNDVYNEDDNGDYDFDVAGIGRIDDSNIHNDAQGTGLIRVLNPTGLENDEFLMWGHDNRIPKATETSDVPSAIDARFDRVWRASEVDVSGSAVDVGSVDMRFDLSGLEPITASDLRLLVDADGVFSNATVISGATLVSGSIYEFSGVSAIANNMHFTIATADASSTPLVEVPGGVAPNLALWLKADHGTSTTTDGGALSLWDDQSGNGNDVGQATSTRQPTFRDNTTNNINFNPVVDFDGSTEVLLDASGILGSATYNDLNVYSVVVTDFVQNGFLFVETCNPKRISATVPWGDGTHYWDAGDFVGNYRLTAAWGGTEGIPYLWSDLYSTTSGQTVSGVSQVIERNGLGITSDNTASSFTGTNNTFYLGGNTSLNLDGKIAEIAIYTGPIDATQNNKIESYLAIKYGITLDNTVAGTGDYLDSDGTLLWDADANSGTFHNDVAGIGRDDKSALDQQKSQSINADAMVTMDKGIAFSNDQDFILWGNDNGATTTTSSGAHPSFDSRLIRIWKAAVSGSPGNVSVTIDFANDGVENNYGLHVDADGDFSSGSSTYIASSISGDTITFDNVSLADGDFFTLGVRKLAPGGVDTGLTLWLKADTGTKNGGSTVSSGAVDEWEESSGNADVSELTVGTDAPTLLTNGINYNPSLHFDGIDDELLKNSFSADLLFGSQDNTFFYVFQRFAHVAGTYHVFGGWEEDADPVPRDRAAYFESNSDGTLRTDLFADGGRRLESTTDITGKDVLATVTSDVTSRELFIDGFQEYTEIGNSMPIAGNIGSLMIGNRPNSNISHCQQSYTSEYIIYNTALSETDVNKVETYLAIKYAITLDNSDGGTDGDYIASDGTFIWDADADPAYHNEIIVIGRDDKSALYQRQSRHQDDSLRIYIDALAADNASNTGTIANDTSFIVIGHDGGVQQAREMERPLAVKSRFEREWKITNTNFDDTFSLEIEWDSLGPFDITQIRLLVDDDGDFSDAQVLGPSDGLTFSVGSIIVSGISTAHIPKNSTRFITIGSINRGVPLPIELVSFEATVNEEDYSVKLDWQTAAEIDNDFFTIEKSKDAQDWAAIKRIEGAGNSSERLSYSVVDPSPYSGTSYYRLKQTDYDGQFTYSNIRAVNMSSLAMDPIKIYPNPGRDVITLEGDFVELADFRIYNLVGKDVSSLVRILDKSSNSLKVDISRLPEGVYSIKTQHQVMKFIKK